MLELSDRVFEGDTVAPATNGDKGKHSHNE